MLGQPGAALPPKKFVGRWLIQPLVKTAFFGQDANWGRIIAAIGYAGVELKPGIGEYQILIKLELSVAEFVIRNIVKKMVRQFLRQS